LIGKKKMVDAFIVEKRQKLKPYLLKHIEEGKWGK
jgi:hypothetical protein